MLESLCQGAGTIHELNVAGAFPERAVYRPRERYAALKATPLFDAERGQWNYEMCPESAVCNTERDAAVQLYGVLAESQCTIEGARGLYEKLQATALYEAPRRQWNARIRDGQMLWNESREAGAQLLGVLVEAQFNREEARIRYEKLKTTPLYDAVCGQWNWYMFPDQERCSRNCYAGDQLLGVLVEGQFDPKHARVLYEKLKSTQFYDGVHGQWNYWISHDGRRLDMDRYAHAQLLGVLVEAQFNPEQARMRYEKLKTTPLYDPADGQWNLSMSEVRITPTRGSAAQLLGVLVEAKLLSTVQRSLTDAVPPLPITEEW